MFTRHLLGMVLASSCIVFVATAEASSLAIQQTLSVTNANDWGKWGPAQYCAEGTYAVGYDMKIEKKMGSGWFGSNDDTSLNGIKISCQSPYGDSSRRGSATSSVGHWGDWNGVTVCDNHGGKQDFLTSFRLQSEKKQGRYGDDTSANFVKFKCRDLKGIYPSYEMSRDPGNGHWGTYGWWSSECTQGTAICGIQTKVESPQGSGDDTALNDVRFYCCT